MIIELVQLSAKVELHFGRETDKDHIKN